MTDHIPIEDIDVPVSMWVSVHDDLCVIDNARWTRDQIGDAVVRYTELPGPHARWLGVNDWLATAIDDLNKYKTGQRGKKIAQ